MSESNLVLSAPLNSPASVVVAEGTVAGRPVLEVISSVVEVRLFTPRSVVPAPPVELIVISLVPTFSDRVILDPATNVMTPDPEVLEFMIEVVEVPAPTDKLPSFEFELSAAVRVIVEPDSVTNIPAVPCMITAVAPLVLDKIPDEFPVAVVTVKIPSLETSPSDSL